MGRIVVFSSVGCGYCKRAKALLERKGLDWYEIDVANGDVRKQMMELSGGKRTVPQVFVGTEYVGGYDALSALEEEGQLDALVEKEGLSGGVAQGDDGVPEGLLRAMEAYRKLEREEGGGSSSSSSSAGVGGEQDGEGKEEEGRERTVSEAEDLPDLDEAQERLHMDQERLEALIERMHESLEIKNRWSMLRNYRQCFVGSEFVEWLLAEGECADESDAVALGQYMVDLHLVHHVSDAKQKFENSSELYRFQEDEESSVINTRRIYVGEVVRGAEEVSEDMRTRFLELFDAFISEDGQSVDYEGLSESKAWKQFVRSAAELQVVDVSALSTNAQTAFWLNLYNVLCIAGYVEIGVPGNMLQRMAFYGKTSFNVGGQVFSLDDIEHGVLRGNAAPPGRMGRVFGSKDARLAYVMEEPDPRVHFALVCGAKSCPAIRVFSKENVQEALEWAAEGFCEDNVRVEGNKVHMSMIFKWYKGDFGASDEELLERVAGWCSGGKAARLREFAESGKFSIKWDAYDWSVNG